MLPAVPDHQHACKCVQSRLGKMDTAASLCGCEKFEWQGDTATPATFTAEAKSKQSYLLRVRGKHNWYYGPRAVAHSWQLHGWKKIIISKSLIQLQISSSKKYMKCAPFTRLARAGGCFPGRTVVQTFAIMNPKLPNNYQTIGWPVYQVSCAARECAILVSYLPICLRLLLCDCIVGCLLLWAAHMQHCHYLQHSMHIMTSVGYFRICSQNLSIICVPPFGALI